jgi:hypothetical protein
LNARPDNVRRALWAGALLIGTLAGFAVPLYRHEAFGQDWKYFDSLSLVVRSIVLHYHRAPLQDPWVMGGMDILANPQSRIFSPSFLADVFVPPPFANLTSIIGFALFGIWGMFRLLRSQGVSLYIAAAGSLIFVHSTWFGLHFGEGHIPFEAFQLMPWILYFGLGANRAQSLLALPALLALFLLDGGPYPFIYSIVLLLACTAVGLIDIRGIVTTLRKSWKPIALGILATGLVACAKIIPLKMLYGDRKPELDVSIITPHILAQLLFDPRLTIATPVEGSNWRFQEFGCYIGILSALIVFGSLFLRGFLRQNWRWFVLMIFFLWIASGFGHPYNPWWVFQRLPLINNAHVQSRFLLLFHLIWVLVCFRAISQLVEKNRAWMIVPALLVIEALVVKNYTFQTSYAAYARPEYTTTMITAPSILNTVQGAAKPWHYFDGTHGAKDTYEPARIDTYVRAITDRDYRGEVYVTEGHGTVKLINYIPGRIELECDVSTPSTIEVNANWLTRWVVKSGAAVARGSARNLINLDVPPGKQTIVIAYSPPYLVPVLIAFFGGIALFIECFMRIRRKDHEAPEPLEANATAN